MISDVLFEAIEEIERYQRELPQAYSRMREDIELVKKVLASLQARLDTPPVLDGRLSLPAPLTADERELWRVTCEAFMARWTEWLRLVEPVSAEQLVKKLDDAIQRQEALLNEGDRET